ncbi:MAG: dienelactone hydrolase family protein [Chloroflexi bacterium]|nr:MAG: dienelactone hydrolase family protein [Chloroflexota bacterium]
MDIQIQVNNQPVNAYLALPPAGKGPGVLLLHAWWGLKPFFKQVCDQLAEQGFVVLAPDLYHGPIAATIDEAKALMEAADSQKMGETIMTAKDFLLAHPARTGEKLGVLGFSMGAGWSLMVATRAPEQFGAVVAFYGAGEADFCKLQAKYMGHFSDADEWEPLKWVNWMADAMKTAGVDTTIFIYPGVAHWFVESDRPEYDPAAAKLAWERTFAFLKENL